MIYALICWVWEQIAARFADPIDTASAWLDGYSYLAELAATESPDARSR